MIVLLAGEGEKWKNHPGQRERERERERSIAVEARTLFVQEGRPKEGTLYKSGLLASWAWFDVTHGKRTHMQTLRENRP